MMENAAAFKKAIGDRQYTVNMMNMIFKGDMEPMLQNTQNPDWVAIESKVNLTAHQAKKYCCAQKQCILLMHRIGKIMCLPQLNTWKNIRQILMQTS